MFNRSPSGHESIVNSVLFHPSLLHIVTAGIERHTILHSPTKSSPCTKDLSLTSGTVRELPAGSPEDRSRLIRAMALSLGASEFDVEMETVALFDECAWWVFVRVCELMFFFFGRIIRTEGEGHDLFLSRGRDDSEDEDEDGDGGESDEDLGWC